MARTAVEVHIRRTDLDASGRVRHAGLYEYLQQARVALLLSGPHAGLLGGGLVVTAHQVWTDQPISGAGGDVQADVWVGEVGASRFAFGYVLCQGGRRVARAATRACVFDFEHQRPRRLRDDERGWLGSVAEPVPTPQPLPRAAGVAHVHPVRVRWSDLDAYGHVGNTVLPTYLDEARAALFAGMGHGADVRLHVERHELGYLQQLHHRLDAYEVHTAVSLLESPRLLLTHRLVDPGSGAVIASGVAQVVVLDDAGRAVDVPDGVRTLASA